jgi:hypothetical protein
MGSVFFERLKANRRTFWFLGFVVCWWLTVERVVAQGWTFDWSMCTDPYNKPRGIYEQTPFPITESSTSYTVTNEDYPNGITFDLGTLYFVDGAVADDSGDGTWARPFKTITHAISAVTSGNKTVVVRGPHGAFDGTYVGSYDMQAGTPVRSGTDDTHRYMIVGYGQERPLLDGNGAGQNMFGMWQSAADWYWTIQRLIIINAGYQGIQGGSVASLNSKYARHVNVFDIHFYNCGNNTNYASSGSCYAMNADYWWISHCRSEHSWGHGYKIGDGASSCRLEWSEAVDNGWWPGITAKNREACGLDFPCDQGWYASNNVCRYNLASNLCHVGTQWREQSNMNCHHNEIVNWGRGPLTENWTMLTESQGLWTQYGIQGTFHDNVLRQEITTPYATANYHVLILQSTGGSLALYNNLIVSWLNRGSAIRYSYGCALTNLIANNTIIQTNQDSVIDMSSGTAPLNLTNNVIYYLGSGQLGNDPYGVTVNHYANLYYYPNGSAPQWGTSGDLTGDPLFVGQGNFRLQAGSPAIGNGIQLNSIFVTDADGNIRGAEWDIGAYQCIIRPVLNIVQVGTNVLLSWPTNHSGYTLESALNLNTPAWTSVAATPVIIGNQFIVTNAPVATNTFYRLRSP